MLNAKQEPKERWSPEFKHRFTRLDNQITESSLIPSISFFTLSTLTTLKHPSDM